MNIMQVLKDCPRLEHASLCFQALFNCEASKLHFLITELFILKVVSTLSESVNAELDTRSPFFQGACVQFLLSCTIWFYVIPGLSELRYEEKKNKLMEFCQSCQVSPGFISNGKARLSRKTLKSAQIHSTLGPSSLKRVVSLHKPFEESGLSFKSVLKPVIRQASRALEFR